ncbi:MAG: type II secretion system protein [Planctomycetota bacterium]
MVHTELVHGWSAAKAKGTPGTPRHSPNIPGFTLVELLVVVSIIALLISILVPSLSKARQQAKLLQCLSNQSGLARLGLVFSQDHEGRFQLVTNDVGLANADSGKRRFEYDSNGELLTWPVALAQAAKIGITHNRDWGIPAPTDLASRKWILEQINSMPFEFKLPTCPGDAIQLSTPFYPTALPMPGYPDPPEGSVYWGRLSFGINEDLVGAEVFGDKPPAVGRFLKGGWRVGQVSPWAGVRLQGNVERAFEPSTVLLITDAGPSDSEEFLNGPMSWPPSPDSYINLILSANVLSANQTDGPYLGDCTAYWWNRVPTRRHPKSAVGVIFADYHGDTATPSEWRWIAAQNKKVPKKYNARVRVSPYNTALWSK